MIVKTTNIRLEEANILPASKILDVDFRYVGVVRLAGGRLVGKGAVDNSFC